MEQNLRLCKVCNTLKQRIEAGKFDAKNKKWKDEDGLIWNGSTCGSCNKKRVRIAMRIKRDAEKN